MTLIIGLNLSNKIYLAGDTRVTSHNNANPKNVTRIDNILKLDLIWGNSVRPQNKYDDNSISVAVAGDVQFASFLVKGIKSALNDGSLSSDIRLLAEGAEDILRNLVDFWLAKNEYRRCCLLFGGTTKVRPKNISEDRLKKLIDLYHDKVAADKKTRAKFAGAGLENDPLLEELNKKIYRDTGKTLSQMLKEGESPTIPRYIQDAINNGQSFINTPDSLIVGFDIDSQAGIKKETAEWGEFLSFGVKLAKENIKPYLLAALELGGGKRPEQSPHMIESVIITTEILDFAKKNKILSIGGTVVLFSIWEDGQPRIMGKDVVIENGKPLALRLNGQQIPLASFHKLAEYRNGGRMEA